MKEITMRMGMLCRNEDSPSLVTSCKPYHVIGRMFMCSKSPGMSLPECLNRWFPRKLFKQENIGERTLEANLRVNRESQVTDINPTRDKELKGITSLKENES
jgi:hypothetical protein